MKPKPTLAGIGASAIIMGGVDASVLNETPLEHMAEVANERVEAKQIGNVVETTMPWKGEPGLTIKYDLGNPTATEKLADKRKKEVITKVVDFGDGGFKVDILLNEKPDTNVFCYQIEGYENYDFFYQPPLTEQEISDGAERPEEITGSYAVYHKTLKNHRVGGENYATGKVMHIPYPYIWEVGNEENKIRAEDFTYNEGNLCVTAQQDFLDSATYPVRIDPTFGYESKGETRSTIYRIADANLNFEKRVGRAFTLSESGTLDSISVLLENNPADNDSSVTCSFMLNRKNSSGSGSHDEVAIAESTTIEVYEDGSDDFQTINMGGESLSADDYIINAACEEGTLDSGDAAFIPYDTGSTGDNYYESVAYSNNPEDPWTLAAANSTNVLSIYATYTATGGGGGTTGDTYWDDDF